MRQVVTKREQFMERPLTQNIKSNAAPLDLQGYERAGGYQAVRKALQQMTPAQVTDESRARIDARLMTAPRVRRSAS